MKISVVFLVLFLSFSNGSDFIPDNETNDTTTATTSGTTTLPPITDISVNVTWTYSNATNITSFIMTVKNLKASEWAAIGFGQQQLMVNNFYLPCQN
jgi:hypothetical protein